MDFGRTQITGLLNNTAHEKAKFVAILHKLKTLLNLSRDHKLILTPVDKLLLTAHPEDIYEYVNYKHPIIKILTEYLGKTGGCPNGSLYFVSLARQLIEQVTFLLDNGIKPKRISDTIRDVVEGVSARQRAAGAVADGPGFLSEETRAFVGQIVKNKHVANLLVECIEGTRSFDSEKIRICKIPTGSLEDSYRIDGLIFNRRPEGAVESLTETTIGIFNCPLDINRPELKGTVLFKSHGDLFNFTKDETNRIRDLVDTLNVNVLAVSGKVDSLFLEFVNRRNILVLRIFGKYDLKRLCDCVGGRIYNDLGAVSGKGSVRKICTFTDGGSDFTRVVGSTEVNTIVLKNSVREVLDENERVIVGLLDGLKKRKSFDFSGARFHADIMQHVGRDGAVREAICKALSGVPDVKMLLDDKVRCLCYALEFVGVVLEIDDYLVAKKDVLDIKPPRHNGHWDEDH